MSDSKTKWVLAILLLIVLFGFYLRIYHIDYPSIGYHNWKESRYITAARNFAREGFFEYGFFAPAYDYPFWGSDPSGAHSDFFPISSISAAIMFKVFGFELWAARLPGIIASVLTIVFMFLVVRKLFGRDDIALVSAFLTAINPVFTFYSHNVQQMAYGMFLVTVAWYLFLRWCDDDKAVYLLTAAFIAAMAVASKYTFAIALLPLAAIFPYSRFKEWRSRILTFAGSALLVLPAPFWWLYTTYVLTPRYGGVAQGSGAIGISPLFEPGTFSALKAYAADNYPLLGVLFAVIGLVLFLVMRNRLPTRARRFTLTYVLLAVLMFFIIPESIKGHNYHQFPVVPVVIILVAYLFIVIGVTVQRYVKLPYTRVIVIAALFLVPVPVFSYAVSGVSSHTLLFASFQAKNRQFDTQFFGLDVAGDYIRTHKKNLSETVMQSSHQAYGLLWHGDIKGGKGIPGTLDVVKEAEDERNVQWLFIYQWDFNRFNNPKEAETWNYLFSNYRLVQVGLSPFSDPPVPNYLLLRRGGNFSLDNLGSLVAGKQVRSANYELTRGTVAMNYITVEP